MSAVRSRQGSGQSTFQPTALLLPEVVIHLESRLNTGEVRVRHHGSDFLHFKVAVSSTVHNFRFSRFFLQNLGEGARGGSASVESLHPLHLSQDLAFVRGQQGAIVRHLLKHSAAFKFVAGLFEVVPAAERRNE